MHKLSQFLIKEFTEESSKKSIKFFRSHGAHGYLIWLTLISYYLNKKSLSVEKLVLISSKFASRRTILDFINKGNEEKYLTKLNSKKDKRKVLIVPTEITIKEFKEWSNYFIINICK